MATPHRKSSTGGVWEFLVILVVTFALVFGFVRPFVVEAFYIPSESMVPTLEVGDRVFVNKIGSAHVRTTVTPIIVMQCVDYEEDEDLIKRVVGVPGDEITVLNGALFV